MSSLIIIPTYNERENIKNLIFEIIDLKIPDMKVLVIDDNSPDGTADEVKNNFADFDNVRVLERKGKKGRGLAGMAGFDYALKNEAEKVIEMDADFSHHPKYIPTMLKEADDFDVVIGSRFVRGGSDSDRGFLRKIITIIAAFYVRIIFRTKIKDVTSGFRCFRRGILEKINFDSIKSSGPSIVTEILYAVILNKASVKEVPIEFKDRKKGKTKLKFFDLINSFLTVINFTLRYNKYSKND